MPIEQELIQPLLRTDVPSSQHSSFQSLLNTVWILRRLETGGVDQEDEERVLTLLENRLNQMASASGELHMTVPMFYLEGEKPDGESFHI